MIQLKSILHPTDFSETALDAKRHALALARAFGATLHLLHVVDAPFYSHPAFGGYVPDPDALDAYARTGLENWIQPEEAAGLTIVRRHIAGTPFVEIIADAKKNDIDLIVIGTHGRSALLQTLMGSTAERIVRKSPCPVLTVRAGVHPFEMP